MGAVQGIAPTGMRQRAVIHAVENGAARCGKPNVSPFPSGVTFNPAGPLACRKCCRSLDDEAAYASLADEFNDAPDHARITPPGWVPLTIDDFEPRIVKAGRRYAEAHGLSWPPQVGDFDRYYERQHS